MTCLVFFVCNLSLKHPPGWSYYNDEDEKEAAHHNIIIPVVHVRRLASTSIFIVAGHFQFPQEIAILLNVGPTITCMDWLTRAALIKVCSWLHYAIHHLKFEVAFIKKHESINSRNSRAWFFTLPFS